MTVKGFKKCCISTAVDGTDDGSCGMTVRGWGCYESGGKMKALTLSTETVTLIGIGG